MGALNAAATFCLKSRMLSTPACAPFLSTFTIVPGEPREGVNGLVAGEE